MENYKILNKELTEQIQAMRINLKLYCDEIVALKAELMEKHESLAHLRIRCYNWAVRNMFELIQDVRPGSDILPILREYASPQDRSSNGLNQEPRNFDHSQRSSSSQLSSELRRSNSIILTRRLVCNTSPIRRSNDANENDSDNEEDEGEIETLEHEELSEPQQENLRNLPNEDIIYEESEEENSDENYSSQYESVDEIINVTDKRHNLREITNNVSTTSKSLKTNSKKHISTIVGNGRSGGVKELSVNRTTKLLASYEDQENNTDEHSTSMELEDTDREQQVRVSRGRHRKKTKRLTDNTVWDIEEDTLQEPRRDLNEISSIQTSNRSIVMPLTCQEVTTTSPSLLAADLTLRNFKQTASSTPNSKCNSLQDVQHKTPPTNSNKPSNIPSTASADNSYKRPSRRCKPQNLSEPTLNTKLRNESSNTLRSRKPKKIMKNKT